MRLCFHGYDTIIIFNIFRKFLLSDLWYFIWYQVQLFHSSTPEQNGRYFADEIFKHIFLNGNVTIAIEISLKFVPSVQLTISQRWFSHYLNKYCPSSLMHICGTRGRWVNTLWPIQNGSHFADDIFKCISLNENVWIRLKFHWSLFLRVQLTIIQHWFR